MAPDPSWWSAITETVLFLINNLVYSGFRLFFWVKPRWILEQMPSQEGKVILITGANSGVGLESARALYSAGARVYMACRSESKAKDAIAWIKGNSNSEAAEQRGGELVFLQLDLADLNSVVRAADEFLSYVRPILPHHAVWTADLRSLINSKEKKLDVLMANAGIMATAEGQHTKQGYVLQTGTNVLGHHALISRLLPVLLSTSRSNPAELARVIVLSSAGHAAAPRNGIDYRSLVADPDVLERIQREHGSSGASGSGIGSGPMSTPQLRRGKHELARTIEYGQAKWGDLVLAKYLESVYGPHRDHGLEGRRVAEGELISFAVHPGLVATELGRHLGGLEFMRKYMQWFFLLIVRWPDVGALNQLWAATMPVDQARQLSGAYIVPFHRIGRSRPDTLVRANQVRLWDWCEEQIKKHIHA